MIPANRQEDIWWVLTSLIFHLSSPKSRLLSVDFFGEFHTACGVRKKRKGQKSINSWNCFGLFAERDIGKTQLQKKKKEQPKVILKLFLKNFIRPGSLFPVLIFNCFWYWVVIIWSCETTNTFWICVIYNKINPELSNKIPVP